VLSIANVGTAPIAALNLTVSANSNMLHVPIEIGCGSPASPAPCQESAGPFPSLWVTKAANFPNATFPGKLVEDGSRGFL
jgi:hypothetical protein